MSIAVKICGLTDDAAMDAAIEAGADYLGLVFFDKSPRAVTPEQAAELTQFIEGIELVGLFVDPDDALLERVLGHVRLDLLQFHGSETPERLDYIRREFAVPVMKALSVSDAADLKAAEPFYEIADHLLFDAKPPKGAVLPGGNGIGFDWSILSGWSCPLPWILAGGLTVENVAEALRISGAGAVDVSSGVESAPGVKDVDKIAAFIRAAKGE